MRCIFYFLTLAVCPPIESTSLFLCCAVYISRVITVRKRSWGQGNVFTAVCHSVHRVEGVSLTVILPGQNPPPWTDRDPLDRDTTWTETPLNRDPTAKRPPWTKNTPRTETPPQQRPCCTVKTGRYTSYWNAFLLMLHVSSLHNSKLNEGWSSPGVLQH